MAFYVSDLPKTSSIVPFLKTLLVVLALDGLFFMWSKTHFQQQIVSIQKTYFHVKYEGVVLAYCLLAWAIQYMLIEHRVDIGSAAVWGFVVYGLYESTNYALFKNWKLSTVFLDSIWGSVLVGSTVWLRRHYV